MEDGERRATMSVSPPAPIKDWVEGMSHDGRFGNASGYVRHLICKDQARQDAIAALQAEITVGVESGSPVSLHPQPKI